MYFIYVANSRNTLDINELRSRSKNSNENKRTLFSYTGRIMKVFSK